MAGHHLIDAYLRELAGRLPADAVDELADGLQETWRDHLSRGSSPAAAAAEAIAEFGTPRQVTDAFVAQSPGRGIARILLATGPVAGVGWGASLIAAEAWTWPIPAALPSTYAVLLLCVVGCLLAAAGSKHSYRRTRFGLIGAVGLIALDTSMLAGFLLAASAWVWPVALAVPASLIRITITLRLMPIRRSS